MFMQCLSFFYRVSLSSCQLLNNSLSLLRFVPCELSSFCLVYIYLFQYLSLLRSKRLCPLDTQLHIALGLSCLCTGVLCERGRNYFADVVSEGLIHAKSLGHALLSLWI